MKRKLAAVLALTLLLGLCGCSKKGDSIDGIPNSRPHLNTGNPGIMTEPTKASLEKSNAKISFVKPFRNDRAWVVYRRDGETFEGFIDKSGNVIAEFDDHNIESPAFDNGYAHILSKSGTHYVVDTDCNVVSSYSPELIGGAEICEGGGYLVAYENVSTFDKACFQFTVYNPDGSKNGSFTTEQRPDEVRYLGSCIFGLIGGGWASFYCAKSSTLVEDEEIINNNSKLFLSGLPYSVNGYVKLGFFMNPTTWECGMAILSETGELKKIYNSDFLIYGDPSFFEDPDAFRVTDVQNGICFYLNKYENKLFSVNVATGAVTLLDSSITENAKNIYYPDEGLIVALAEGADGRTYCHLFDTQFNQIGEPFVGRFKSASDGKILVEVDGETGLEHHVYDYNGNFLFSLANIAGQKTSPESVNYFSCGMIPVHVDGKGKSYIDANGSFPFDTLTFNGTKDLKNLA